MNLLDNIKNEIWEFIYEVAENIYNGLLFVMKEMINLITTFPSVREITEIHEIWLFMIYLSTSCIGLIFVYLAIKSFMNINQGSKFIRDVELKIVFSRMLYMIVFILGSLPFIDLLILFNNTLVKLLVTKFDVMGALQHLNSNIFTGNLIATVLIIYQMYLALKIMIGYWLRVAEVILMTVISPTMMVLWINPNWGGYLSQWTSRLISLIFTQFIQVLILSLYAQIVHRFFTYGSVSNLCLAAAFLILMTNVPNMLQRFIAADNSAAIMSKTYRSITSKTKKYSNIASKIKNKFTNIIKKK